MYPEQESVVLGLALWALIFWAAWRCHRWGKRFLETNPPPGKAGQKKWEQDEPMAECFDDMPRDADPTDDWWYD